MGAKTLESMGLLSSWCVRWMAGWIVTWVHHLAFARSGGVADPWSGETEDGASEGVLAPFQSAFGNPEYVKSAGLAGHVR